QVFDAFGNVATGYTGTVHWTTSASTYTLPADYQFTAADAGVHTFTNAFTLSTSGTQTLTATDTVNGSLTATASIDVSGAGVDFAVINGADGAVKGGTDEMSLQRSKVNSILISFQSTITSDPGAFEVRQYTGSTLGSTVGLVVTSSTVIVGG